MDTYLNVAEIVKRAKQVINCRKDSELADFLEVSRATVSNWCARNRIDFPLLIEKFGKDIDYNWLLMGKGNLIHHSRFNSNNPAQEKVEIVHKSKTEELISDRNIILYDITAVDNLKTLFKNKHQYAIGEIQIPSIPLCDGAIYISGDSMYPILKSGDIVGFKEVNSFEKLIYGEMYLISFNIEGDEYLSVKYVNRSDKEGCLKLVSYNAHHEAMDIPFDTVNAMAIVKISIRRHMII